MSFLVLAKHLATRPFSVRHLWDQLLHAWSLLYVIEGCLLVLG